MAWDREKERKAGKAYALGVTVFALIFVVIWCVMAIAMGAWFMALFAIPMLGILIVRMVAVSKQDKSRRESRAQEPWEQPDDPAAWESPQQSAQSSFCPYCGAQRQEEFSFCPQCGRRF